MSNLLDLVVNNPLLLAEAALNGLLLGGVYAIMAYGLGLIYGVMRTADAVTPMPGLVYPFLGFTILYCFLGVIVGWLLGFSFFSITGAYFGLDAEGVRSFLGGFQNIHDTTTHGGWVGFLFYGITLALIVWVLSRGISGGIEKLALFGMPILFIFAVLLMEELLEVSENLRQVRLQSFAPVANRRIGSGEQSHEDVWTANAVPARLAGQPDGFLQCPACGAIEKLQANPSARLKNVFAIRSRH